jgi:hypothetical protein
MPSASFIPPELVEGRGDAPVAAVRGAGSRELYAAPGLRVAAPEQVQLDRVCQARPDREQRHPGDTEPAGGCWNRSIRCSPSKPRR